MPTSKPTFLPLVRALAETYQAFATFSADHIRELGLTPPQFDLIATLGNTPGMTCKELSEKTLITKGTLTGVIDRLLEKGLLSREECENDRRSYWIRLTEAGQQKFDEAFPQHLEHMRTVFEQMPTGEMETLRQLLLQLKARFPQ